VFEALETLEELLSFFTVSAISTSSLFNNMEVDPACMLENLGFKKYAKISFLVKLLKVR
jgi:hypothetical protein